LEFSALAHHYWPYTCLGAVTGFLVGLTGVGGGALMTPMLILFGMNPSVAVGTDLLYASATKGFAIWRYQKLNLVDWPVVKRICLGSLPTSLIIIAILHSLPSLEKLDAIIQHGIGFALVFVALFLVIKPRIMRRLGADAAGVQETPSRRARWLTILGGVLLGALITITSIGAGALGIVLVLTLYPRLQLGKVVGTDLSQALPITLCAALGHMSLGHLDPRLLGALLLGSLPAVYVAAKVATRVPEQVARLGMAVLLAGIGGRMIVARVLLLI
jgi:uncharacterized membrane protein YfcA